MKAPNGDLICDLCASLGEAGSAHARSFEVTEWQDGDPVHLCPRCAADRRAGLLASAASIQTCARCGRDDRSVDDQWWHVEGADGRRTTYCMDCWVMLRESGS
jgi:hypothetical protein